MKKLICEEKIMNELYIVRWPRDVSSVYVHGATLTHSPNQPVYYANEVLSPGQIICTWQSLSNYLESGIAPSLPLLKAEKEYTIQLNFEADNVLPVQLQIEFFDSTGAVIASQRSTDYTFRFKVPKGTLSYNIHLVNLRHRWIKFDYLVLQEVVAEYIIEKEFKPHCDWIYVKESYKQDPQELRLIVNYGMKRILPVVLEKDSNAGMVHVYTDGVEIVQVIRELMSKFKLKYTVPLHIEAGINFYGLPEEIIGQLKHLNFRNLRLEEEKE